MTVNLEIKANLLALKIVDYIVSTYGSGEFSPILCHILESLYRRMQLTHVAVVCFGRFCLPVALRDQRKQEKKI